MPAEWHTSGDAQWERMSRLFETLLSLPPGARSAFLDASCGGDAALHHELATLVAAHDGAPAFLDAFHGAVVMPALAGTASVDEAATDGRPASDDSARAIPGTRIRHITVHERLGSGGAGVVHRGRDTLLDRDVALKFLAPRLSGDPAARARLVIEAQAASRLDDPHVCAMHAIETTDDGGLCLVMAYCGGGTLRDRLRQGAIAAPEVQRIARQLTRGLASAHRAGIVHGDIKPANVGFGENDVVRVLDFGIAGFVQDAEPSGRGIAGTLPYLAPELWRGGTRTPQTDVWALGVTFFEMVTGRRPFAAREPGPLADAIREAQVGEMTAADGGPVPPAFEALVRRMLSPDPAHRPADADAVLAVLDATVVPPTATSPRASRWRSRTVAGVAVGVAALLGGRAIMQGSHAPAVPALEVARTSVPISSLAVLPFTTRGGREIDYLANGMIDVLTPAFDGTGLVRGIDPNTVIGAAGDGAARTLDSASAQALAERVNADRYVVGSVVGRGGTLTIRATLRRRDGREVGRAQASVPEAGALGAAADSLVRQLIATELLAPGDTIAGIAAATTQSSRALRLYLDGERDLRDARPAAAMAHFQAAVAVDSLFALAWYRLARAARWNDVDSLSASAARRAATLAGTLPPRQQALVRAYHTLRFGSPLEAERQLTGIVTDYPTDVEAWMLLGETQFGSNPYYGRPLSQAGAAFRRVMALDPRNREVTVYLMDLAATAGQAAQLDTLFTMYFSPNSAGEQPGIRSTYLDLHRRRVSGGVGSNAASAVGDDPARARVALERVSSDPRDRRAARAYAAVMTTPDTRTDGILATAMLDAADGDWQAASSRLATVNNDPGSLSADVHAWLMLSPAIRLTPDSLRATRQAVLASPRRDPRLDTAQVLTAAEHDDIRQYLAGLLSVRLGDASGVEGARTDAGPPRTVCLACGCGTVAVTRRPVAAPSGQSGRRRRRVRCRDSRASDTCPPGASGTRPAPRSTRARCGAGTARPA